MASPRLPRFRRSQEIVSFELTRRDEQIIQVVRRHRFLRSSHIVALIGGSPQVLLRRLQMLYHHGYLERPRAQIDYYHKGGSRPIVYGLGNKGADYLARELGIPFAKVMWSDKNRAIGRNFLQHALLISDVMVTLELCCQRRRDLRLLSASDILPLSRVFEWRVNVKRLNLGVQPDQVFGLEFADKPIGNNRAYFFVEADTGTMPVKRRNLSKSSFFRKLLAYEATWSQQLHRSRFGFHRFRVVTITTSRQRLNSLAESCAQLERGHGLFLFGNRDDFISHTEPLMFPLLTGNASRHSTLLD